MGVVKSKTKEGYQYKTSKYAARYVTSNLGVIKCYDGIGRNPLSWIIRSIIIKLERLRDWTNQDILIRYDMITTARPRLATT